MRFVDHVTDFHLPHFAPEGIGSVITVVTLRRVAVELLGLFSPLYVLFITQDLGFSLRASILVVFGYFLLIYITKLFSMPLAENISFRLGYRRTLVLSVIPFFLFIGFLLLSQRQPLLLALVAVFWGIDAALFWFGYHGLFAKRADQEHFGKQTGLSQALYVGVGVATPIIGSLVVIKFGFQTLFLIAGAVYVLAMMVALLSREIKPHHDARVVRVFRLFKTHPRIVAGYFGWGFESVAYGTIWPIFLFLLVGKIMLSYGGIFSASVLLAALITYLVGLVVDKMGEKNVIILGSMVGFLTWTARAIVRMPLAIIGIDSFYRVTDQMLHIPLHVRSYKKAVDGGTGQALYFHEISICLGAATYLLMAWILVFFNFPLWVAFLLASLGTLAPIFMTGGRQ